MENKTLREARENQAEEKVRNLLQDIRQEEIPPQLLELAQALQGALDALPNEERKPDMYGPDAFPASMQSRRRSRGS